MFSTLRTRFGIPGVISVIALVFAMFGGAYAASNSSGGHAVASKAKKAKTGQRGPRGPRGATGPAGPQGPAGPVGAKGDAGAAGANGANGAAGEPGTGATTTAYSGAECPGPETGIVVHSASPDTYVCDGEEGPQGPQGPQGPPGQTGFAAEMPEGATETGVWVLPTAGEFGILHEEQATRVDISFPFALPEGQTPVVKYINPGGPATEECPGSVASPEAAEGFACVYKFNAGVGLSISTINPLTGGSGAASRYGFLVNVVQLEEEEARTGGTWAVTAKMTPQ